MIFQTAELLEAVRYGQKRTEASKNLKDNWGLRNHDPVEDARRQTVGTLGEWAVAKYFNVPYVFTVNTFKAPDLIVNGVGIQAKASEKAEFLTIRRDAKDDEPYVLCHVGMTTGDPRQWGAAGIDAQAYVTIMGWMYPWQARLMAENDPCLWRDPGRRNSPAIFIPHQELFPMAQLREIVYSR